ncbi:MAG TPA: TonB-dependent receptor [Vicinamibacterales bacterium]|nr:TonB-dependent receptor [Vicinamibacterales bacterium]
MGPYHVHAVPRCIAVLGLLLTAANTPAFAQGEATIRGQVVAAANGSVLAAVPVTLAPVPLGESVQITTDQEGRFSFRNVRPGEYILSAAPDGFIARELRFVMEPRETRVVMLSLELRGVDVGVQVTGEPTPLASTHSPSSTVLSAERLENMPVSQRTNLPDAIVTSAPGMIRGHDDFVHIRGHEIALNPFINGVSFWENVHTVFSAGMSLDVIDTANIMTGGFSAEYGNRFGGVVDVVTKSGLTMQNDGSVSVNGGQAGRRNVSGEFGGHRGRVGYYVFGSMFESDRFLSPPVPEAIHDSARGGHAFVQLDWNLGRAGLLRALFTGDGANFEIPKTPQDVQLRPLANADQRTRQQTAIVGWRQTLSDLAINASFYQRWSQSRLMPAEGPLTAIAALDRKLLTIGGKVDATRFVRGHAIKAGVDAVRLRPDENLSYDYSGFSSLSHLIGAPHIHFVGGAVNFSGRDTGGQFSAYAQDGIQLGSRVTADLGIRLDHYDLVVSDTHASPRANVAVQVGGGAVVHGSYNHFFVPPAIEGVLSSSAGLTARIREIGVALPALEPTIENQFELGGSAPVGPVRLAITGYYRATDNPVHTTVWPDSRIYSYASFNRARAYGLETKAELPLLARFGITGYANYALGRVNFYNPVTGGFVTEAEHLTETSRFLAPMDQTHTLTTGATYRNRRTGLWMGTAMEYGSGTPMGHGGAGHVHAEGEADHVDAESAAGTAARVPGHFTANLSFGVDLLRRGRQRSRLSFQLDIENIADNVYLIAQEGEFSPAQYSIPRLISVTAKVRF